jgi:hypothetical protein
MSGTHNLLALLARMQQDAESVCAYVLPHIERNLCDGKRRKTFQGVHFYLDNAPAHNAKRPRQEITQTKVTRVMSPAYSPDAASSVLFLWLPEGGDSWLHSELTADILSATRQIFHGISKKPSWTCMINGSHRSSG